MKTSFLHFFEETVNQLDEAVKVADFDKVARLIQKYLKKYVGKVYYYPSIEEFSSAKAKGMKGIRFFVSGGASFRLNWARQKTVKATAGVVSMDFWDGNTPKPKRPTSHVEFKNDESLATVLPFIRDFLNAELNSQGKKFTKSGVFFDDDKVLAEAYTDPNELAETARKIIGSLASGIPFKTMGQTGGTAHYGAPFNKVVWAIKIVYKPYMKKQGVSIAVDPEDAKKFDVKKIVEFIIGDSVSFDVSPGAKETIEVKGVDQVDLDRMTYEEQLDSLKTGMKLLMGNATNSLWVGGRGGCLDESTEVNIIVVDDEEEQKANLGDLKSLVSEYHCTGIEPHIFYNIRDLGIQIETPTGFKPIRSFVEKEGELYIVQFENGAIVKCANNHFFMTPVGKVFASSLKVDDVVLTNGGTTPVSFIQATGETQKFYDIEVDSDEHVFLTADGILHHNTGKTQTVEDMLSAAGLKDGDGYFKITGSASPTGIYRILFDHKNSIILFDDSDSALLDQEGRNLFKAASDTKKVRKISWMKGGKQFIDPENFSDEDLEAGYLPRWFEFSGKIIFISNLSLEKLDPDQALRTRGFCMNVDPTNEEIYEFMGKIANKISLDVNYTLSLVARLEVVEVLKSRNIKDKTANLRSLVRGLNTRAAIEMQGGSSSEWMKFVKVYA